MKILAILWERKTVALCAALSLALGGILGLEIWVPKLILFGAFFLAAMTVFVLGLPRPETVLCVLAAYLPFGAQLASDAGSFPAPDAAATVALALIAACVYFKTKDPGPWIPKHLRLPLAAFLGWALIAVIQAAFFKGVGARAFTEFYRHWILPVLICFAAYRSVRTRESAENVTWVMLAAAAVIGLLAIREALNVGESGDFDHSRVGGIANDPNILAAFLVYVCFLPLGYAAVRARKGTAIYLVLAAVLLKAMLSTFSRGGYVAFAAGIYALAFFRKKWLIAPLVIGSVFLLFNPQFLPESVRTRLSHTLEKPTPFYHEGGKIESSLDKSNRDRIEIWKGALQMTKEHPVFGVGYTLFHNTIRFYWPARVPFEPHNTYLHISSEMGIPALLAYLAVLGVLFAAGAGVAGSRDGLSRSLGVGFMGAFVSLLASQSYVIRLDSIEISAYFWILAGVMFRLKELEKGQSGIFAPRRTENLEAVSV